MSWRIEGTTSRRLTNPAGRASSPRALWARSAAAARVKVAMPAPDRLTFATAGVFHTFLRTMSYHGPWGGASGRAAERRDQSAWGSRLCPPVGNWYDGARTNAERGAA